MADHYRTLLEEAVRHPETPLGEMGMLTGAERERLLNQWNDTAADRPGEGCIHEIFQARVQERPDGVALRFPLEVDDLFEFRFEDFELTDYRYHEHIKAAVAV